MKTLKIRLVVVLSAVAMVGLFTFSRPTLYLSEDKIHTRLLTSTPIGSSRDDVKEYIWKTKFQIEDEADNPFEERDRPHNKIGESYMEVYLGGYRGIPFWCDVTAYWVFDSNDRLLHVDIWKCYDSL